MKPLNGKFQLFIAKVTHFKINAAFGLYHSGRNYEQPSGRNCFWQLGVKMTNTITGNYIKIKSSINSNSTDLVHQEEAALFFSICFHLLTDCYKFVTQMLIWVGVGMLPSWNNWRISCFSHFANMAWINFHPTRAILHFRHRNFNLSFC